MIGNRDYKLKIKKTLLIITIIFSFLFINGCTLPESIQVLDKETKEPISDVVICYIMSGTNTWFGEGEGGYGLIKKGILFSDKKGRIYLPGLNTLWPNESVTIDINAIGYKSIYIRIEDRYFISTKDKIILLDKVQNDKEYYNTIISTTTFRHGLPLLYTFWTMFPPSIETRNETREFVIKMCEDFIKKYPKSKYYNNVLYIMGSVYSDLASGMNISGRDRANISKGEKINYDKTAQIYKEILANDKGFGDTTNIELVKKSIEKDFPVQYEEYKKTSSPINPAWPLYAPIIISDTENNVNSEIGTSEDLEQAEKYLNYDKFDSAISIYDDLINQSNDLDEKIKLLFKIVDIYSNIGKNQEAQNTLDSIIDLVKRDTEYIQILIKVVDNKANLIILDTGLSNALQYIRNIQAEIEIDTSIIEGIETNLRYIEEKIAPYRLRKKEISQMIDYFLEKVEEGNITELTKIIGNSELLNLILSDINNSRTPEIEYRIIDFFENEEKIVINTWMKFSGEEGTNRIIIKKEQNNWKIIEF